MVLAAWKMRMNSSCSELFGICATDLAMLRLAMLVACGPELLLLSLPAEVLLLLLVLFRGLPGLLLAATMPLLAWSDSLLAAAAAAAVAVGAAGIAGATDAAAAAGS